MTINVATFRLRYAAFATVPDERIGYWLQEAVRTVTTDWGADQEAATFALAAHSLAQSGALAAGDGALPYGVTRFRSGSLDIAVSDAAQRVPGGGFDATSYGREYLAFCRAHFGGGPMLVGFVC